jgi:hypothetical protein
VGKQLHLDAAYVQVAKSLINAAMQNDHNWFAQPTWNDVAVVVANDTAIKEKPLPYNVRQRF